MAGRLQDKVAIVVGAGSSGPGWSNGFCQLVDALTPATASWYAAAREVPLQRFACRGMGVGRGRAG
jgi:hypothetical protein